MNANLDQNNLMLARLFNDHYENVIKPEMARLELVRHPTGANRHCHYDNGFSPC